MFFLYIFFSLGYFRIRYRMAPGMILYFPIQIVSYFFDGLELVAGPGGIQYFLILCLLKFLFFGSAGICCCDIILLHVILFLKIGINWDWD